VRIHYYRPDGNYSGWQLYGWNAYALNITWCGGNEVPIAGTDSYGVYFNVPVNPTYGSPAGQLGFIINNCADNQLKDPGVNQYLQTTQYNEAWIVSGDATVYTTEPTAAQKLNGVFSQFQAYWLDRTRVAIQPGYFESGNTYAITWSLSGGLQPSSTGIAGGQQIPLTPGGSLTKDELTRYPQLASYTVLTVSPSVKLSTIEQALKGQIAISSVNDTGTLVYATGIQDAGVLDDLYYYPGSLGVLINHPGAPGWFDFPDDNDAAVKLKLWAPTAQSVSVAIYNTPSDTTPATTVAMHEHNGVWVACGTEKWIGKYYLYTVNVYVPSDKAVDVNTTSDPYSIDIALNGTMSRITDLDADATKPEGWDESISPPLESLNDLSIYELHVRDFSVDDPTVSTEDQGTYEAFADENSNGMRHLHALAQSGLKAVHILPSFHFSSGSVNEDKSTWESPGNLTSYPADGLQQQAAVTAVQNSDAYNWGYDPVHYMAPEGSYAINPDDRVYEYRVMVQGLHRAGLRVIQDVVFNHTNASGEGPNSNLDEVVPLYYHRLDTNGNLETGSCCPDTASEHRMMEKLMIDTLVMNAEEYKIDGFRFDLMDFHFTYNMQDIKRALNSLTLRNDGVDGSKIYLYGEGWNFAETENNAIGPEASQLNLYGYGIGTFNDRIRDGIRGDDGADQAQGFATGLATDPSEYTSSSTTQSAQVSTLLQQEDWIRVGLSGNLRDFTFTSYTGATVTGAEVLYGGSPAGYTATPIEAINYCSVHDNQDLFDAVQEKASLSDPSQTRARRQVLAMSVIELGQAVPFFQGGDDLLRSKDMDQNSYNSGDWFNKIDWSGTGSNWGIGLPISSQNESQWTFEQPLLANSALTPQPAEIGFSTSAFQEFMAIRYSSALFRMSTLKEIQQNLSFLNTGTTQTPGLIVMKLDANNGNYGSYKHIVVVFNASNTQENFTDVKLQGLNLHLDPIQAASIDAATRQSTFNEKTGTATVPALTTAVFVSE
jgi:pullulanase